MASRKFYVCGVGEPDKGYDEENLKRIISNKAFILHEDTKQKGAYTQIEKSAILILKFKHKFIGFGESLGIEKSADSKWNLFAPVKNWFFKDKNNLNVGVNTYGIGFNTEVGGQYGTVKEIALKFGLETIKSIDPNTNLYQQIANEVKMDNEQEHIKQILEYKKQIILQGPPGTGKTRLAEELAETLITPKKLGTPIDKIHAFLKNFDVRDTKVIDRRNELNTIKNEFYLKYPKESLNRLTLEDYAFGDGANESFCWWIEYNLFDFGGYSGFAQKFLIFWKKGIDDYVKHGFVKNVVDDQDAMHLLAEQIFNIANEINLDDAKTKIGNGFLLKILNTYHPEKYFPINAEIGLTNGLKLLGINPDGLNFIDKSKKLQEEFIKRKSLNNSSANNIEFMSFLYQTFDMKGSIRIEDAEILSSGESKTVIFHPSYTYEDFVRGITIQTTGSNQPAYIEQNKILAEFAKKANDNPSAKYVLILDEINRANLSSVLGELIYALEYRGKVVTSMYKDEIDNSNDLVLPKNLYIIGTMNTADRSVGHIDYAIRRRFAFVSVLPKKLDETHDIWFNASAYDSMEKLFSKTYVTSDFDAKDVQIGHSYFIVKKEDAPTPEKRDAFFKMKMKYEVLPILNEYLKDGILNSEAEKEIVIIESSFT